MIYARQRVIPSDFGSEVSRGRVSGYTKVNKFGQTSNADNAVPTDIWDGSTTTPIWVPPTVARIHAIASASDVDSDVGGSVAQGAGLRTVRVFGLLSWDLPEVSEDVIMDGTNPVNTADAYVIIYRIVGLTWGANGVNTGLITATAATDSTITAEIVAGGNQTQMIIFGVPSTQSLQIKKIQAEIVGIVGATRRAECELLVMTDPVTSVGDNTAWINKENFSLEEGDNPWSHDYGDVPKSCPGPCILKIQATATVNDTKVTAAMDAYIVDNP